MNMGWFLLLIVIVGFLVWVFLSDPVSRGKFAQFSRKMRKAGKFHSRVGHPPFKS